MNIGIFSDSYFPLINGVTTSLSTLAKQLENLGHTVYIFAPDAPDLPHENDKIIRMPSMPCAFVKNARLGILYSPMELAKISVLNLDIIHTQTEFPLGICGKILSKTLNIPMVHTYHTMYEDYVHYIVNGALITPAMAKEYSKVFCNYANAVIAPTQKVQGLLRQYGVTKHIEVIPTGINIDHFRKANYSEEEILDIKKSIGIENNNHIVLSLGRVAKEKSIDVIIKAFPKLIEKLPDAKLVIVGDGPVRDDLEKLAKDLQITNHVIFTGAKPYSQIGKYYQLGNVFASASVTETQGLTFAEAMAAGIPVVAKKDPSIEGIVTDRETGFLFNNDDEVADKLYEVLSNSSLQEKTAQKAMNFIESLSAETFAKSVESLYIDILNNHQKYGFKKHTHFLYSQSQKDFRRKAVKNIVNFNDNLTSSLKQHEKNIKNFAQKTISWHTNDSLQSAERKEADK